MSYCSDAKPRKRIDWVDIAKGISILCVIIGHTVDFSSVYHKHIYIPFICLYFSYSQDTLLK